MEKTCRVQCLGSVPYQKAWDYQNYLAAEIAAGRAAETLLLLEHPHTYTLGRRGLVDNLLWSEAAQAERGVAVFWVDRGGGITYHGPGQLVGYPILQLAPVCNLSGRLPQADFVGFIRQLEEVLIRTLQHFEIEGYRVADKTGVWVKSPGGEGFEKIASIGVKVDAKGISRHGFALNVQPDMDYWEGIVPCGLTEVVMTSMVGCKNRPIAMRAVQEAMSDAFGVVFERVMLWDPEPPVL